MSIKFGMTVSTTKDLMIIIF